MYGQSARESFGSTNDDKLGAVCKSSLSNSLTLDELWLASEVSTMTFTLLVVPFILPFFGHFCLQCRLWRSFRGMPCAVGVFFFFLLSFRVWFFFVCNLENDIEYVSFYHESMKSRLDFDIPHGILEKADGEVRNQNNFHTSFLFCRLKNNFQFKLFQRIVYVSRHYCLFFLLCVTSTGWQVQY